jgi:ABC-2 type transport system permease protein
MLLFYRVPLSIDAILFIPLLLELVIFSTGLAFILSTMFVYLRDINNIWDVILQLYMYLSVIIYPITSIIAKAPFIAKFALLNPMAQIIQDMRHIISGTPTVWSLWGDKFYIAIIPVAIVIGIFVIGLSYFNKKSPYFAEDI